MSASAAPFTADELGANAPSRRRPPRNRRLSVLFAVGWILLFASALALYGGGQWIYTGHSEFCEPGQSPANGTCGTGTFPYTVAIVTPAGLAVLMLAALYPLVAYLDRRWPLRAVAVFVLFGMTVGTLAYVYRPIPHMHTAVGLVNQPTVSALTFFATLLLAAGAAVCVYGLIERPSGVVRPRSRARPLRHSYS